MTKREFQNFMDRHNNKLRTDEEHQVKWVTIQVMADIFSSSHAPLGSVYFC